MNVDLANHEQEWTIEGHPSQVVSSLNGIQSFMDNVPISAESDIKGPSWHPSVNGSAMLIILSI